MTARCWSPPAKSLPIGRRQPADRYGRSGNLHVGRADRRADVGVQRSGNRRFRRPTAASSPGSAGHSLVARRPPSGGSPAPVLQFGIHLAVGTGPRAGPIGPRDRGTAAGRPAPDAHQPRVALEEPRRGDRPRAGNRALGRRRIVLPSRCPPTASFICRCWTATDTWSATSCCGCTYAPEKAKGASAAMNGRIRPPVNTRSSLWPCPPILRRLLPTGDDQFRYRAKAWFKGHLPDEREERQRTVQSITLFGRP
jgi:hypothetical protein